MDLAWELLYLLDWMLIAMLVGAVSSNTEAGQVIAVAPVDSQVTLDAGNEAAFYWDFKLFGFTD